MLTVYIHHCMCQLLIVYCWCLTVKQLKLARERFAHYDFEHISLSCTLSHPGGRVDKKKPSEMLLLSRCQNVLQQLCIRKIGEREREKSRRVFRLDFHQLYFSSTFFHNWPINLRLQYMYWLSPIENDIIIYYNILYYNILWQWHPAKLLKFRIWENNKSDTRTCSRGDFSPAWGSQFWNGQQWDEFWPNWKEPGTF